MKIVSGSTTYTDIKNLRFAPQTDITGLTAPVNEFTVDIVTTSQNLPAPFAELYDDLDNLWAKYWVTDQINVTGNLLRVKARSLLWPLDRVMLPAVMYEDAAVMDVLDDIFATISQQYDLDSSFATIFIDGFCPEQSARERLQWVCFVIGGYINTCFTDVVEILPVQTTADKLIPANKTYWQPQLSRTQATASVRATVYSFREGTPQGADRWVTDGTTTWIVTTQEVSLSNPSVGDLSPSSVVCVDNVTIVNSTNINGVLSRLAGYYFQPREADADVINNAEYFPGDRVQLYVEEDKIVEGNIDSTSFSFGMQAKSRLHISGVSQYDVETGQLIIDYMWALQCIQEDIYDFPAGYTYKFENPFFDRTYSAPHQRFIIYPYNDYAQGVVPQGGETVYEFCDTSLKFSYDQGILEIFEVDEIQEQGDGELHIS